MFRIDGVQRNQGLATSPQETKLCIPCKYSLPLDSFVFLSPLLEVCVSFESPLQYPSYLLLDERLYAVKELFSDGALDST